MCTSTTLLVQQQQLALRPQSEIIDRYRAAHGTSFCLLYTHTHAHVRLCPPPTTHHLERCLLPRTPPSLLASFFNMDSRMSHVARRTHYCFCSPCLLFCFLLCSLMCVYSIKSLSCRLSSGTRRSLACLLAQLLRERGPTFVAALVNGEW